MSLRVLYVDFNSYFASVEQQRRPELRGQPVAVLPVVTDTTCFIAASCEARRFGVKNGGLVETVTFCIPVKKEWSIEETSESRALVWRAQSAVKGRIKGPCSIELGLLFLYGT